MTNINNQEQEVKFYLGNLPGFESRLQKMQAVLRTARVFENNLRFDLPDGALTRAGRALRLRQDETVRLTYKGPMEMGHEVNTRAEIEFEASSFDNAKAFLEALGYRVSVRYEKYRATYDLGPVEVVLDELPFGDFVEIEGPNSSAIQTAADVLGLNWDARCNESYLGLFTRLRTTTTLDAENLTFDEVKQKYPASAFGLKAADL
jgi:adenylate cyclase, class 2